MRRFRGYRQLTVALTLIVAPALELSAQAATRASAPQPAAESRRDPTKVPIHPPSGTNLTAVPPPGATRAAKRSADVTMRCSITMERGLVR